VDGFTLGVRFGGKGRLVAKELFVIPHFQEAMNTSFLMLIAFAATLHSY